MNDMATSNKDIISALKHGDFEILNGVVSFIAKDPEQQQPASKWLAERRNEIENYIIRALKLENAYRYVDYSTGSYGPKKSDGVTLTFDNIYSGDDAFCVFNADIRYQRGARAGKKLPKKKYKVKRRSKLKRLLDSSGLNPRRPSEYCEHMGKLREIVYTADLVNPDGGKQLDKDSIKPLHLEAKVLTNLLKNKHNNEINGSATDRQFFGNYSANTRQPSSANTWPNPSNNETSSEFKVRAESSTDIRSMEMRTHGKDLDISQREPFGTINLSDCTVEAWVIDNIEEAERLKVQTEYEFIPF
jgi:hypothetical protein